MVGFQNAYLSATQDDRLAPLARLLLREQHIYIQCLSLSSLTPNHWIFQTKQVDGFSIFNNGRFLSFLSCFHIPIVFLSPIPSPYLSYIINFPSAAPLSFTSPLLAAYTLRLSMNLAPLAPHPIVHRPILVLHDPVPMRPVIGRCLNYQWKSKDTSMNMRKRTYL